MGPYGPLWTLMDPYGPSSSPVSIETLLCLHQCFPLYTADTLGSQPRIRRSEPRIRRSEPRLRLFAGAPEIANEHHAPEIAAVDVHVHGVCGAMKGTPRLQTLEG